jgi:outer membrane biogenesis lipoprotein LolB
MPDIRYRVQAFAVLVSACFLLCHCSARLPGTLTPESEFIDPRAEQLLNTVLAANEGLESIKGMGRVKLLLDDQLQTFRAAWGGKQPDRFRLDVLVLTGQPVTSFACDGQHIYFLSYLENKLYRSKASAKSLKRIISIDMTIEDFLDLISGRLPVEKEGGVRLEEKADSGLHLLLDGSGRDHLDTIYLDADGSTVRKFERREPKGKLLYRVVFGDFEETDGFRLPESVTIQDENGRMVHVDVERAWVNPGLTDEQFVLKKT